MIAAIGDRLQYVRQKQQVGSHLEPYTRATLQVPDQTLNWAALRGLDRAISQQNPQAKRVLLNFQPSEADYQRILSARNEQRGAVTTDVLLPYLRAMPQRQEWDQIMTITPAYRFSEVNGMGSKFAGVGVYVQPLARQSVNFSDGGGWRWIRSALMVTTPPSRRGPAAPGSARVRASTWRRTSISN
jgi:hypothetical protein